MKYYMLNKKECRENINVNPVLVKTKSAGKIKKYQAMKKKLERMFKEIEKELKESNSIITPEILDEFINTPTNEFDEIVKTEYNAMYGIPLYDTQLQRMIQYNKTAIMRGKLIGLEIKPI